MTTRELLERCLDAVPANNYRLRDDIRAHLAKPDETAELLREMGEALEGVAGMDVRAQQALEKYKEMTK
jgi:hypothetical protein